MVICVSSNRSCTAHFDSISDQGCIQGMGLMGCDKPDGNIGLWKMPLESETPILKLPI